MSDVNDTGAQPTAPVPATSPPVLPAAAEACKRDRMKLILSLAAMGYLCLVTIIDALVIYRHIQVDGGAAATMNLLAGAATGYVKDAFSFVFGSSQGSEDKTAALAASATAAPPAPAKAP